MFLSVALVSIVCLSSAHSNNLISLLTRIVCVCVGGGMLGLLLKAYPIFILFFLISESYLVFLPGKVFFTRSHSCLKKDHPRN